MEEKVFSFDEVSKHNTTGDCWLLIHGKVYDVSRFLDEHPGGDEVLLNVSGIDASHDFEEIGHTSYAKGLMKDFLIGNIEVTTVPKMKRNTAHDDASSSKEYHDSSSQLLVYVLPLFILAAAYVLRYYYNNND